MSASAGAAATSSKGIGLITLVGGGIAGGAVAFSVATSGQAAAMPEELTRLVWYAIRVTGICAYLALWLTTVAGVCISGQFGGRWLPGALLYPLHQLGDLALSLMVLHAALLLGDHYAQFTPASLVVPFTAIYRPEWTGLGIIALYLAAIVYWSVHFRPRIGYRAWRAIHLLSFVAFLLALAHGFASGTDSSAFAMRATYLVTGQIAIGLISLRIWRAKPKAKAAARARAAEQTG
jgi:methionine sulfoxide reductase heme-binding subunit